MFSKRARGYDESQVDPTKRFRRNVGDAFLSNALSGKRAQSLINDAAAAGAGGVDDLRGKVGANSSRDLIRKYIKRNKWPKMYTAQIRMKDKRTDEARDDQQKIKIKKLDLFVFLIVADRSLPGWSSDRAASLQGSGLIVFQPGAEQTDCDTVDSRGRP